MITAPRAPLSVPDQARAAAKGRAAQVQIRQKHATDTDLAALVTMLPPQIANLGVAPIIDAVALALPGLKTPIVLDPVMVTKGGDRLLLAKGVTALRAFHSAADLLGCPEAVNPQDM